MTESKTLQNRDLASWLQARKQTAAWVISSKRPDAQVLFDLIFQKEQICANFSDVCSTLDRRSNLDVEKLKDLKPITIFCDWEEFRKQLDKVNTVRYGLELPRLQDPILRALNEGCHYKVNVFVFSKRFKDLPPNYRAQMDLVCVAPESRVPKELETYPKPKHEQQFVISQIKSGKRTFHTWDRPNVGDSV